MDYADKELCERLYELTGWHDVRRLYFNSMNGWVLDEVDNDDVEDTLRTEADSWLPAYTLGYILDKFAQQGVSVAVKYVHDLVSMSLKEWEHKYIAYDLYLPQREYPIDDTAPNAAIKLLIQLIEKGVIDVAPTNKKGK